MALSLVGGAFLGAAAGELLKAILDAKDKSFKFKPLLEQLQSTLERVTPKIEEIIQLDRERFDRQRPEFDKLTAELDKAKKLVRKCERVPDWNLWQSYRFSKKLMKLDNSLLRFFQFDVSAGIWSDLKQISVDVHELQLLNRGIRSAYRSGLEAWCSVPQLPSVTVGLEVPLRELKRELFRDGVKVLGLCAPGGCGKTTLAAKLCQDKEVQDRFKENIFFLTVSSSPNLKVILQRLIEQIGHGDQFCDFQNDEDAVKQLRYFLRQREPEQILLVLDDVWSEALLQKFVFGTEGYKMLVTSRTIFRTFDSTYSLKMLSDSDAMTLFCGSAFPEGGGDYERPDEALVNKVVRGCRGLPLALKVIGNSLCRQPTRKWRKTRRILWKGSSIFDTHKDLLDCLATSIDFLEDAAVRECFLDLGCFSKDQRISASAIIDIWVELYELDEDDAYVNLLELSNRYLINLVESTRTGAGEIDSDFNELFVVQHDLLRDLAIYKNKVDQNIRQRKRLMVDEIEDIPMGQDLQAFDAHLVSIYTGEQLPSRERSMQFPEAEALLLNVSAKCFTLPSLIKTMAKLKVLIISNNGPQHVELHGLPAIGHLPHLKRIRLEKVVVPSLNVITEPMESLQKISLVMCEVGHALNNCNDEIYRIFPNLIEIDFDYCDDLVDFPRGICKLSHLQKLSITNCHNLSALIEGIGQLTDLEVLRLHACTGLLELPDSLRSLHNLRFLDISECSNMKRMPEGMDQLWNLRKLDMRLCSRMRRLPRSIVDLRELRDVICDEETSFLWQRIQVYLPRLNITVPKYNFNLDWLGIDLNNCTLPC